MQWDQETLEYLSGLVPGWVPAVAVWAGIVIGTAAKARVELSGWVKWVREFRTPPSAAAAVEGEGSCLDVIQQQARLLASSEQRISRAESRLEECNEDRKRLEDDLDYALSEWQDASGWDDVTR